MKSLQIFTPNHTVTKLRKRKTVRRERVMAWVGRLTKRKQKDNIVIFFLSYQFNVNQPNEAKLVNTDIFRVFWINFKLEQ